MWKVPVTGWFIIQRHRDEKKGFCLFKQRPFIFLKNLSPREPFALLKYLIYRSTSDGKYMEEKRLP